MSDPKAMSDQTVSVPLQAQLLADSTRRRWSAFAVFIALSAVIWALAWKAGFTTQTAFIWSANIPLDGGWRVFCGQVPHHDFHSPIGYLYLHLIGACMHWFGPMPDALTQAAGLLFIPAALWAWALASRRLPPVLAVLAALLLPLHLLTVTIFGSDGAEGISLGGQYSRASWGLFFLIAFQVLVPARTKLTRAQSSTESAVSGVLIGVLFGFKITYVAAALALLGLGLVLGTGVTVMGLALVAAGALVAVVLGLGWSHAHLGEYLADLRFVSHSKSGSLVGMVAEQLKKTDVLQLALLVAFTAMAWAKLRTPGPRTWLARVPVAPVAALALLGIGTGLSAMNGTEFSSPVYAVVLLVLLAAVVRPAPADSVNDGKNSGVSSAVTVLAALVLSVAIGRMALPLAKAARHQGIDVSGPALANDSVDAKPWQHYDWVFGAQSRPDMLRLVNHLNQSPHLALSNAWLLIFRDGIHQLRERIGVQTNDVVVNLDAANPFPFALGLQSPKHDVLYWHFGRNVSVKTAPAPAELLTDATIVMVPKYPMMEDSGPLKWQLYADYVQAHFRRLQPDSLWWSVWVRPDRTTLTP